MIVDAFEASESRAKTLHAAVIAIRHGLLDTRDKEKQVLFNYLEILIAIVKQVKNVSISHIQYLQTLDNAKTLSILMGLATGRDVGSKVRDKALEGLRMIGDRSQAMWPGTRSLAFETVRHMKSAGIKIPKGIVGREGKTRYRDDSSDLLLLYSSCCFMKEEEEKRMATRGMDGGDDRREYGDVVDKLTEKVKEYDLKTYERKRVLRLAASLKPIEYEEGQV